MKHHDMGRVEMEATHLRGNHYAVRPKEQLGTMGWHPCAWSVQFINANSKEEALRKAKPLYVWKEPCQNKNV